MEIVTQSLLVYYCPFPLLTAPKIAGLLPAPKPLPPPTFTYANPRLIEFPLDQRDRLFTAARLLLDVAIAHHAGEMADHALNTALAAFRRAILGHPIQPTNPSQYAAQMDIPLLEWLLQTTGGAS
jgi:hypothetical protein